MSCMVSVVFGEPKSTYSNARQNISGTSSSVRRSTMFRSRPAHHSLVFTWCTAPLGDIARRHGINVHMYAVDSQLYLAFSAHSKEDTIQALMRIQYCVAELQEWI